MGSYVEPEELTVLVTGFGPFKEKYPVNPSWEIASGLPAYLPADRAKDPDSSHKSSPHLPAVRILVPPEPIRVNYEVVRGLVPTFWDGQEKIDYAIHIGMAGARQVYQIERRAHRNGYIMKDVDGNYLKDEERHALQGDKWIWDGLPAELFTDLDIEDIKERWVAKSPKQLNFVVSDDPGRYLCDFTYYSSLAHLTKQERPKKVLFWHVPQDSSDEHVRRGRELAINLIRAVIESDLGVK